MEYVDETKDALVVDLHRYNVPDKVMLILSCEIERSISMFKQILVPLDGSARAEQAAQIVREVNTSRVPGQLSGPGSAFRSRPDLSRTKEAGQPGVTTWALP